MGQFRKDFILFFAGNLIDLVNTYPTQFIHQVMVNGTVAVDSFFVLRYIINTHTHTHTHTPNLFLQWSSRHVSIHERSFKEPRSKDQVATILVQILFSSIRSVSFDYRN